jgi:hypothetical protein
MLHTCRESRRFAMDSGYKLMFGTLGNDNGRVVSDESLFICYIFCCNSIILLVHRPEKKSLLRSLPKRN